MCTCCVKYSPDWKCLQAITSCSLASQARELKEPRFPRTFACSLIFALSCTSGVFLNAPHAWFITCTSAVLFTHRQAVSGLDSIRAHPLPSPNRASLRGRFLPSEKAVIIQAQTALQARLDDRMVPLVCWREKESEAGCDVAACPPVAADSAPKLPGTDPEPRSDVTPTFVMQVGASQEM